RTVLSFMDSKRLSTDGSRQTCATLTTFGDWKPAASRDRMHSSGSLKRKNGGPSGNGTLKLPYFAMAPRKIPKPTTSPGLDHTVHPNRPPGHSTRQASASA